MNKQEPFIKLRPYQQEVFWSKLRMFFLLWARQKGKSYTFANRAFRRMMENQNHLVIFVSASILLGGELLLKEAAVWQTVMTKYKAMLAANKDFLLRTSAEDDKGNLLDIDAIADLFEHNKLEAKIWHSNTSFSRTRVVAPNPNTAVGWTGDVYMDEVGRIENLKDVFEAVMPIIDSNPLFEFLMATTPPPDDKHYSFEMFLAPEKEWPHNPRGNWYESPSGIAVHRVDAWDGQAAGVHYYDSKIKGKIITPEEHRQQAFDKIAWDRNHGVKFIQGGTAAISLADIQRAMELGRGNCFGFASYERTVA